MNEHLRSAFRKMAMRQPGDGVYLDNAEVAAVVDEMNRAPMLVDPETIDMSDEEMKTRATARLEAALNHGWFRKKEAG